MEYSLYMPTPGRICGRTPTYKTAWCPNCLLYKQGNTHHRRALLYLRQSHRKNNTKTRIGSWTYGAEATSTVKPIRSASADRSQIRC